MYMCVKEYVYVSHMNASALRDQKRALDTLKLNLTDVCKLHDVGAVNLNLYGLESSKCS